MCRLLTLAVLVHDAATLRVRSLARVSRVEGNCRGALVVSCARSRRIIRPPPRLRTRPAGWVRRAAFALLLACVASGAYGASPGQLCCPRLLSPEAGALLDNGRTDRRDDIMWTFSWTACPGADAYWLVVLREGEAAAVISDRPVLGDRYDVVDLSSIPGSDLTGWSWRVRAQVDDAWQPWSAPRGFSVEPPDSAPPRADLMPPSLRYPVEGQTLANAGTYPDTHLDGAWWFSWSHVPSAVGYQVVVTAPHLREPFLDVTFDEAWVGGRCEWYRATNRGGCSFSTGPGATALPAGMGDWTWRVRAWLGTGWAPWSEAAALAIGPAPGGAEAWIEGRLEGWTAGPARIAGFVWSDLPPLGDGTLAADGTFRLHLPATAVGEYDSELPGDGGPGRLVVFAVLEVSHADGDATSIAVLATSFEAGLMAWAEPSDHVAGDAMVSWWFADRPIAYVGSWQHAYGETRVDVELRHGWNMVLVQVVEVMDDNTWVLLERTVEELPVAVVWHWLPDRK